MIPLFRVGASVLRRDPRFTEIKPNLFKPNQPLYIEKPTNKSLTATSWSTRRTPDIEVYDGRANSRKQVFINLNAGRRKPQAYLTNGVHFKMHKDDPVADEFDPITFEPRGNILRIQQGKRARYVHEGNRRRKDTKARRYRQALRFVNQTYGRYTDVEDVANAWKNSYGDLSLFAETLAVNQAVDRLFAKKSELTRDYVYRPLNIGGTPLALRALWRASR